MIVDAITYLFNWIAEHRKNNFDHTAQRIPNQNDMDPARVRRIRKRAYRKMVLQMEIIPPAVSVTTLIAVTIVVVYQAVLVLVYHKRHENPNLNLMMTFSVVNLGLDGLNVFCFAKAKHLMGYSTTTQNHEQELTTVRSSSPTTPMSGRRRPYLRAAEESSRSEDDEIEYRDMTVMSENNGSSNAAMTNGASDNGFGDTEQAATHIDDDGDEDSDHSHDDRTNLNMCSAYTHVFADTLRSLAVILASLSAEVIDGITPEEADASAAIIVSILIVLSLVPLF